MFNNLSRQAWLSFFSPQILSFDTYLWLFWVFSLVAASGRPLFLALQWTGFSLQGLLSLQSTGCRCTGLSGCGTWAPHLQSPGPIVALQHAGSSWTRSWTRVSCTGRWILYHWAPREAPGHDYLCYGFGALGSISFYLADSILVSFVTSCLPLGAASDWAFASIKLLCFTLYVRRWTYSSSSLYSLIRTWIWVEWSEDGKKHRDLIHYSHRALNLSTKSLQSCLTLCDPMDCSPPGSSVHGIFQARILE